MGVVPDRIKIARVILVYKAGCHTVMSNYRPISLLSIFHKFLEKLKYKRLITLGTRGNSLAKSGRPKAGKTSVRSEVSEGPNASSHWWRTPFGLVMFDTDSVPDH